MRIIGLTGPTGSGKSVVSRALSQMGIYIVDADKIGHDIILKGKEAYKELKEYFGAEIIDENGEIIRRKLGSIVFSQGGEKLEFLNNCTHKYIYEEMKEDIISAEENGHKIVVIDAPLLIEGKFITLCNEVWVVYASDETRAQRIMARDGITKEEALNRMKQQKGYDVYNAYADVIIDNNKGIDDLINQVKILLDKPGDNK